MPVNFQRCSTLRLDLKVGFIHVDSSLLKVLIREIAVYNCMQYMYILHMVWFSYNFVGYVSHVIYRIFNVFFPLKKPDVFGQYNPNRSIYNILTS